MTNISKNKFDFLPHLHEVINELINNIKINLVEKTIQIRVCENNTTSVIKWIDYINAQCNQLKKSPFVDEEDCHVLFKTYDKSGNKINTIKFTNLKLLNHECVFDKNDPLSDLGHFLTISFEKREFL